MHKYKEFTYRVKSIILAVLGWEVLFWILLYQILNVFGVFSDNSTGERVVFLEQGYAWYLILALLFVIIFVLQLFQRNRMVQQLGNEGVVANILRPVSSIRAFWRYFLIRNAIVFVILALMQPAFGNKKITAQTNGCLLYTSPSPRDRG